MGPTRSLTCSPGFSLRVAMIRLHNVKTVAFKIGFDNFDPSKGAIVTKGEFVHLILPPLRIPGWIQTNGRTTVHRHNAVARWHF